MLRDLLWLVRHHKWLIVITVLWLSIGLWRERESYLAEAWGVFAAGVLVSLVLESRSDTYHQALWIRRNRVYVMTPLGDLMRQASYMLRIAFGLTLDERHPDFRRASTAIYEQCQTEDGWSRLTCSDFNLLDSSIQRIEGILAEYQVHLDRLPEIRLAATQCARNTRKFCRSQTWFSARTYIFGMSTLALYQRCHEALH